MSRVDPSLITSRNYQKTDEGYIFSTWLKGLWAGNAWFHEMGKNRFFKNYHLVLDKIMADPETKIRLIVLAEDPDVILSYAVFNEPRLHWVFTRDRWRRFGLARDLITPLHITEVTHITDQAKQFKPKEWEFNPFSI